ncbi:MAG TPA: MCE family protein [Mycobacteriales bacterium]|nr:MCE family protein [Mycobacteriales bacterium]
MRRLPLLVAAAVAVLIAAVAVALSSGAPQKRLTVIFPRVTGLYVDSSVRILGVPVGKITKITPDGTQVVVEISYDAKYKLPAGVDAILVPPSIVSDRYVQLAPVYSGGPLFDASQPIPMSRTEVPVELDQIFGEINQLDVALGPNGANAHGALAQLIQVGAANLEGNGQQFHDTVEAFSQAISTLSSNRSNLFGTLSNLEKFSQTLAQDDGGVRRVSADLATVSAQLDNERRDLGLALKNLAIALGQVASFVQENKSQLTADITGLTSVTSGLVSEKRALEEFLDNAPTALADLALTYDPASQTLRTRNNSGQSFGPPTSPLSPFCQLLTALGQPCTLAAGPAVGVSAGTAGVPSAQQSLDALLGAGQ